VNTKQNVLLRLGPAAERLYGENTNATRSRLMRLADQGEIRVVRIGVRRDRWFPSAEIDRLLAGELANAVRVGQRLLVGTPNAEANRVTR